MFFRRKNIARFEKISYEQFRKDFMELYLNDDYTRKDVTVPDFVNCGLYTSYEKYIENCIKETYDNIIIPEMKTTGSAGHDIISPFNITLEPLFVSGMVHTRRSSIIIPTGLKVFIKKGWVLEFYPRSGWGSRGLKIENTVPIIDWDYYNSPKNEGHILLKLVNESKTEETMNLIGGDTGVVQGLFKIYGTAGKPKKTKRQGGFNSTAQ